MDTEEALADVENDEDLEKSVTRTHLDNWEQWSKIFVNYGKIFLLASIGILGFLFKSGESKRQEKVASMEIERLIAAGDLELSKPWLAEALTILR